jgi:hypothetical protein
MVFREMGVSKKEIISLCNSMIVLDFMDNLKDIHCRTLILCGKKDNNNFIHKFHGKNREKALFCKESYDIV